jgi:DDE superfamily endonuclease
MNSPKCDELDYINFLIAAQKVFSNTEAAKCHPAADSDGPAHDAYTRLLHRCQSDAEALWQEVKPCVSLVGGILVVDDSTLDKFYARMIELVTRHWSGKHHRVVQGINLISLLWTDGEAHLPCDFRVYDKPHDHLSKNDHFQAMLTTAAERGFQPRLVGFDSWYASLKNLKLVRTCQWPWLTQLKANRLVDQECTGNRPIREVLIPSHGLIVHLKGYGLIKVFKLAAPDGSIEYWATSDLTMTLEQCADNALHMWRIEEYHRGLKQFCGIERAQHRSAKAQRNHIGLSLRAFLRLEVHRLRTGVSWFEAKTAIVREAVRAYLAQPLYTQTSTA